MQEHVIWERARLARDARFDGHFFVGVRTTGIYCRPICPANSPKRENIRFFPTAAAAGEAGFRPCLRCRPECAPGTPAWSGTSTTVRRGLRLIAEGALEDSDVEKLAERLGVTSRHLRRLFTKHLGASPLAVAHTQRLHFAKRLIDDTGLPMNHIAAASGYRSVRRFNDAFRTTYGRAPRDLRKVRPDPPATGKALVLRLPYREPFDWDAMLAFFAARATPGVECVDGAAYRRSICINNEAGAIAVRPAPQPGYLMLSVEGIGTGGLFELMQRAREVFDLDAPVNDIHSALQADPRLADLLARNAGIRVPGAWNGFELTVRAILGQQISVKAATTLAGRIAQRYGTALAPVAAIRTGWPTHVFPGPEKLLRARFSKIGIVTARAETIRRLAAAVLQGRVRFDGLQDPDEFCASLCEIRGVGDWTAQYVAMRVLKYPDAFPATDLGLLKAADPKRRLAPAEIRARAEHWRPWRSYAAMLLWNSLAGSGG